MSWSFKGTSFERILSGDSDPRWFPADVATTVDVIAGDPAATPRRYVDIGAVEHETLELTAAVLTTTARDALVGYRGTMGTLTRPGGQNATALLRRADNLARRGSYYRIRLVFELLQ